MTVFAICQGYSSLLELSHLYVFDYFNAVLLHTLSCRIPSCNYEEHVRKRVANWFDGLS